MLRSLGILAAVLLGTGLVWFIASQPSADLVEPASDRAERTLPELTTPRSEELAPLLQDLAPDGPTPETPRRQAGADKGAAAAEEENPPPSTPAIRFHVQLFEHPVGHPQAPGRIWDLGPGLTNAGHGFNNDAASAARVPQGVSLTLYDDSDGQGRRVVLPAGTHELHPLGFGDCVSSVMVTGEGAYNPATPRGPSDAVQLHQHLPREGDLGQAWNLRLQPSRSSQLFRAVDGHFLSNEASAAWVPTGYQVTLFESGDGLGLALVLGPGLHELMPFGFNDRASSARVRRVLALK